MYVVFAFIGYLSCCYPVMILVLILLSDVLDTCDYDYCDISAEHKMQKTKYNCKQRVNTAKHVCPSNVSKTSDDNNINTSIITG
jgi:hypothetical protein